MNAPSESLSWENEVSRGALMSSTTVLFPISAICGKIGAHKAGKSLAFEQAVTIAQITQSTHLSDIN
jgi:hypothetical protein